MFDDDDDRNLGPRMPAAKSWEDVQEITGGLRNVPIEEILNGRIDSEYELPPTGKCGLLNCEQQHGWGYIFAIPGRRYVNIGNVCADRHAPEAIASMKYKFNAWKDERSRAESLRQLLADAADKRAWLDSVEPQVVRGTALRNSFLKEFRGRLELDILERANKRRPHVEHQVSICASSQEVRRAMLQGGRVDVAEANIHVARFEVKHIGDLRGLDLFIPQRDPVSLWTRFRTSVEVLLQAANSDQSTEDMRMLHRIRRDFAGQYNDLVASLRAVEEFFSQKNLNLIMRMPINRGAGITSIRVDGDRISVSRVQP